MCKGYSWRVRFVNLDEAREFRPLPTEWFDTLAEARKSIRGRGPMGRRPEEYGVIAAAVPICDVPPTRTPRGVDIHYFRWTGREVREFV